MSSALTQDSIIPTSNRTALAGYLSTVATRLKESQPEVAEHTPEIDYRNINASVFRTKESINDTLSSQGATTSSLNDNNNQNATAAGFTNTSVG